MMNRTLLEDLEKAYHSIKCETEDNTFCTYCEYCKNKQMCFMIENLIKSIRKHYIQSIRNYYKKFL